MITAATSWVQIHRPTGAFLCRTGDLSRVHLTSFKIYPTAHVLQCSHQKPSQTIISVCIYSGNSRALESRSEMNCLKCISDVCSYRLLVNDTLISSLVHFHIVNLCINSLLLSLLRIALTPYLEAILKHSIHYLQCN